MATPHDVAGARRVTPTYGLRVGRDGLKRRGSGDGAEGSQEVLTLLASGGEDAGADGRRFHARSVSQLLLLIYKFGGIDAELVGNLSDGG